MSAPLAWNEPNHGSAAPREGALAGDLIEHRVCMRDGVHLATDVYLPRGTRSRGGRFPTLLARLPYGKRGPIAFMPDLAAYLNDSGYAVVVQDVRGKFSSEGDIDPFVHEMADGSDTLTWIVTQAWSDGDVGMFGDSYYGYTQWAAAMNDHPALRAIAPRVTSTQIASDWMYHDGVFCLASMADWAATTWAGRAPREESPDWQRRPLNGLLDGSDQGTPDVLRQWRSEGPDSAFWTRPPLGVIRPSRLKVPALHLGGTWDIFRRGQLADWAAARTSSTCEQRLILTSTDHMSIHLDGANTGAQNVRSSNSDFETFLARYLDDTIAFFDHHVRGLAVVKASPGVQFELAGVGPIESPSWPPPGVTRLNLYPVDPGHASHGPEGGGLRTHPDAGLGVCDWMHDPSNLVPTGDADLWSPLVKLPDERVVESRPDVLTFTSEPMRHDCDLVGQQSAKLEVAAEAGPTQVVTKLVHVYPNGVARRITEGVAQVVGTGDAGSSVARTVVSVDLGPTAYRIPAGHRLRMEVSASCFPRYLPVLSAGKDPWTCTPAAPWAHYLAMGSSTQTRLQLSVMQNGTGRINGGQ